MRTERLQFYLEPELNAALERLAATLKVSKAKLIREGVRKLLAERQAPEEGPLYQPIGLSKERTGYTAVAERHDYYLYGDGADLPPTKASEDEECRVSISRTWCLCVSVSW